MTTQNTDLATLYAELYSRCGTNCGLLVSELAFTSTVSAGIATLTAGQAVPTVLAGVSFTTTMRPLGNFSVSIRPGPGTEVDVAVVGVELSAAFHRTGVPADLLSTITFTVNLVLARLAIEDGKIVAHRRSYDVQPVLTLAAGRAAVVTALGWDAHPDKLDTFKRLEDTTLFSAPALVADQFLGNIADLPLQQWLSGLALGDPMAIERFDNASSGRCVLIRTLSSSSLTRAAACPCADAGAPEVSVTMAGNLTVALATAARTNAPDPANELYPGSHFDKRFAYLLRTRHCRFRSLRAVRLSSDLHQRRWLVRTPAILVVRGARLPIAQCNDRRAKRLDCRRLRPWHAPQRTCMAEPSV